MGYYTAVLIKKGGERKSIYIHRTVAEAFCENLNKLDIVNHIDGNKKNNYSINLEWATQSENGNHAYKAGLNSSARKVIRLNDGVVFNSAMEAERAISGNHSLICAVCSGKRKTHKGYRFAYYQ
jgi:hypothetical protein